MNRMTTLAALLLATAAFADDSKIPQWSEAGKDMKLLTPTEGFWNLYVSKEKPPEKLWVEVRHVGKPFLLATSMAGGLVSRPWMDVSAGWQLEDWYLVFEKHGKRLVLLERNTGYIARKDKRAAAAVKRTYTDRVLRTYPIKARGPKGGFVIDGKRLFAADASLFTSTLGRSRDYTLAKYESPGSFPNNTELSVTLPDPRGKLVTLHYSVSRLPKTNYKPREADTRVGYFTADLKDFSKENKDDRRKLRYIQRWHLEKLDPKLELSPPKKPIEFYIEKTVPVRFRRYVREGILEWNKAFEKLGFDNAIVVHQQDENRFAELAPEDVRHNFFRWIYSDTPFAMGPRRWHPETGEILDADIIFDDSYIRTTLQDYRLEIREVPAAIAGGRGREFLAQHPIFKRLNMQLPPQPTLEPLSDDAPPSARRGGLYAVCTHGRGVRHQLACCALALPDLKEAPKGTLPMEVLGQFVKDTVMHEVGHTLGLRHNFKASSWRTLDEIFSEEKPGDIANSVMDYSPIMVAPEGQPQGAHAMRTIGPYDYWAIAFGYTTDDKELKKITARVAEKGHEFGWDEDADFSNDPLINRWDMGADPLEFARSRIKLMKQLRKNLEARAVDEGEAFNRLRRAMNLQLYEARRAGSYAIKFVGGEHVHRDHRGDPNARPPLVPVDAAKQREALDFVCKELLTEGYFEFPVDLLRKAAPNFWGDDVFALLFEGYGYPYLDNVLRVQFGLVYGLTSPGRLQRVLDARHKTGEGQEVLTAPEVFEALNKAVFGDLAALPAGTNQKPSVSDMRRNLQREYVAHLNSILLSGDRYYPPQIQTLVRHYVKELRDQLGEATHGTGLDTYTKAHLEECHERLKRALDASYARLVR